MTFIRSFSKVAFESTYDLFKSLIKDFGTINIVYIKPSYSLEASTI